jgi:transposase InsO family protein
LLKELSRQGLSIGINWYKTKTLDSEKKPDGRIKQNDGGYTKIPEVLKNCDITLSPIVDCFDGMLPAWTIGTTPNAALVNEMLDKAITTLSPVEHPLIHSDRGCHYRWPGWVRICEENGLERSMSKKGCSPDNSACEGFFGRLKNEVFYGEDWSGWSIEEFMSEIDAYIRWYNGHRIKLTLDGMSPVEYRESLGLVAA